MEWFIIAAISIFVLVKLANLAERTRLNSAREELIKEAIKRVARKRKIDELYGRNRDDGN